MMLSTALPREIGRYQIERILGRGAMGTVYLATDPLIQRPIALKTIRTELLHECGASADAELPARFINEARAAGRLVHPHIVSVFDYGEADGVAYIALEYVRGDTLAGRLAQQAGMGTAMPLIPVLVWFTQLLDALGYAHDAGVIHRDIKPANLLIAPRGDCKITDFGIAQLDTGRLTQVGMMIGTPSYMSPEQYRGEAIDARSDLFSAGVVLYEMLTGKCPFSGTPAVVMQQIMNDAPIAPSSRKTELPAEIDAMVLKALAKRPADRYASAQSWRVDLLTLVDKLTARLGPDRTTLVVPLRHEALAPSPSAVEDERTAAPAWPPELLAQLEQRLAGHVGPVASRLVRRAAARATDSRMFVAQLARHLPDNAARREFDTLLERHTAVTGSSSWRDAPAIGHLPKSGARTAALSVDPARVEAAARQLATHIGPIARIVAQRAALGADTAVFHARIVKALPAFVDKDAFINRLDDPVG